MSFNLLHQSPVPLLPKHLNEIIVKCRDIRQIGVGGQNYEDLLLHIASDNARIARMVVLSHHFMLDEDKSNFG
jgi:hypothetical protein